MSLNESRTIIESAKSIVDQLDELAEAPVTEKLVRSVMKEEIGMRYQRIKTVSLHSNSEKNLVLRQRWALERQSHVGQHRIHLGRLRRLHLRSRPRACKGVGFAKASTAWSERGRLQTYLEQSTRHARILRCV